LYFKGADTLNWIVHRHATIAAIFGVLAIAVWLLQRQRRRSTGALEPLTVLCVLLAAQGLVGTVQYELHLPSDMVWVHVGLATATWTTVLWAVAAAGRLVPRKVPVLESESAAWPRRQVSAAPVKSTR
jgi:cytochrome c oxidase assembly protein subunit 15